MESIKIEIDRKNILDIVNNKVSENILSYMDKNMEDINKSIEKYFKLSFFQDKNTQFENALDWTIEDAFREGIKTAMEDLKFKELIAEKAKEILSNDDFIKELAVAKVKSSLGLH